MTLASKHRRTLKKAQTHYEDQYLLIGTHFESEKLKERIKSAVTASKETKNRKVSPN
jgi:hypothetical protein